MAGAYVQSWETIPTSNSNTSVAVTVSGATSGNLLIGMVAFRWNSGTPMTGLNDSTGNWIEIGESYSASSEGVAWYYKAADGTDNFDVAIDGGGVGYITGLVVEYSGLDPTPILEDSDIGTVASSTSVSGGTATPTTASGTALSFLAVRRNQDWASDLIAAGISIDSSYSIEASASSASTGRPSAHIASLNYSSISAQSPTWSTTEAGGRVYSAIAVFKETSPSSAEPGAGSAQLTGYTPYALTSNPSYEEGTPTNIWEDERTGSTNNEVSITPSAVVDRLLVGAVFLRRQTGTITGFTESSGNWTEIGDSVISATGGFAWYYRKATGDANDVFNPVVDGDALGYIVGNVTEWGGLNADSIESNSTSAMDFNTSIATGNAAVVTDNATAISVLGVRRVQDWCGAAEFTGFPNISISDSYTEVYYSNAELNGYPIIGVAYKNIGTAADQNPTWSTTEVDGHVAAGVIVVENALSGTYVAGPDAGSVDFTCYAPTIVNEDNGTRSPASGEIELTGYAPTLSLTESVKAVDAGSLALTGYPPALALGGNLIVQPDVGTLGLTGYAVEQGPIIEGTTGSLALTGYAPTVGQYEVSSIDIQLGPNLSIVGYEPAVVWTDHKTVQPGTGSLTLSGKNPRPLANALIGISPSSGSLAITGFQPIVLKSGGKSSQPDVGSIGITGRLPTLLLTESIELPAGSPDALALTGYAPNIYTVTKTAIKINGVEIA